MSDPQVRIASTLLQTRTYHIVNMSDPIKAYGWTAQARDPKVFLRESRLFTTPSPVLVESVRLPDTPLANNVLSYAQEELNIGTFNHSMRVFYYGDAYTY